MLPADTNQLGKLLLRKPRVFSVVRDVIAELDEFVPGGFAAGAKIIKTSAMT